MAVSDQSSHGSGHHAATEGDEAGNRKQHAPQRGEPFVIRLKPRCKPARSELIVTQRKSATLLVKVEGLGQAVVRNAVSKA